MALKKFDKPDIDDAISEAKDDEQRIDARRFAAVLREELKNATDEITQRFISKVEPIVKRAESADRRISVPTLAAYIILATIVWLFIFLIMVIYANTKIRSDDLTALIVLFFVAVIISIIAVIYFTKKYRW